jgi:hypothetical protein
LQLIFSQILGDIGDSQVPASAVTQHEAALTILLSQLTGWPADSAGFLQNDGAGVLSWASSTVSVLDDIGDVNTPTPADGDVLTWDSGAGEWIAAAPTGGVATLDSVGDVNAPTPADGDVLTWDSVGGEWIAAAPTGGGGSIDGTGTAGALTKWSDSDTLTDSIATESGTEITVAGDLTADRFLSDGYNSTLFDPAGEGAHFLTRFALWRHDSSPSITLARVHGTIASPTATQSGDGMGVIAFKGWDGTTIQQGVQIFATAAENFTGSGSGTGLTFRTAKIGTTTVATRLQIDHDGLVTTPNSRAEAVLASNMTGFVNANTNLTGMSFSIGANEVWVAEFVVQFVESGSSGGVLINFTVPSGASGTYGVEGPQLGSTSRQWTRSTSLTTNSSVYAAASAVTGFLRINLFITNGANAGTVQLRGLSGGATTTITVQAGTCMHARRIS